jgi:hypothetical protein
MRSDAAGNLSLNTTVPASGASTASTVEYPLLRVLRTPGGGKMILS